jgi:hypothetical protein
VEVVMACFEEAQDGFVSGDDYDRIMSCIISHEEEQGIVIKEKKNIIKHNLVSETESFLRGLT